MKQIKHIGWIGLMGMMMWGLIACSPRSEYEKIKQEELARGVRQDSLFLGLQLGMEMKEFYAHCWELNKQGLIRQGTRNESVLYLLPGLGEEVQLNFYPTFVGEKIATMPCVFAYQDWAPWNKSLFGDSLALKLRDTFMDWYGGREFIELESQAGLKAYVKIDGNRQITMIPRDEIVKVLFKDLTVTDARP